MAAVMTVDAQAAALVALLKSIDGVGMVHPQNRIMRSESDIRRVMVSPTDEHKRIRAWMVTLADGNTAISDRHPGHAGRGVKGGGNVLTTFRWLLNGYHAIDDDQDSEQAFRRLAFSVADELNAYGQLDIVGIVHQGPANLERFGYAAVANTMLLHYAQVSVSFQGRTRPV